MSDLQRLTLDFARAAERAPRAVGAALGKGADQIRDDARVNIRTNLSPRFARGIISRRERSGPPAAYVLTTGEVLRPIINAWEVGTAKHGPRPSIAPAFDKNVDAIEGMVADAVKGLL